MFLVIQPQSFSLPCWSYHSPDQNVLIITTCLHCYLNRVFQATILLYIPIPCKLESIFYGIVVYHKTVSRRSSRYQGSQRSLQHAKLQSQFHSTHHIRCACMYPPFFGEFLSGRRHGLLSVAMLKVEIS